MTAQPWLWHQVICGAAIRWLRPLVTPLTGWHLPALCMSCCGRNCLFYSNNHNNTVYSNTNSLSGFGGLEVACWLLVPKFMGSHPAEAVGIFRAKKILSTPSFRGEVKPSVPCRSFTACKRSLNVTSKSAFRQNYRTFLAHNSAFCRWVLSFGDACRRLVAKVGMSNPDSTISPKATVRS